MGQYLVFSSRSFLVCRHRLHTIFFLISIFCSISQTLGYFALLTSCFLASFQILKGKMGFIIITCKAKHAWNASGDSKHYLILVTFPHPPNMAILGGADINSQNSLLVAEFWEWISTSLKVANFGGGKSHYFIPTRSDRKVHWQMKKNNHCFEAASLLFMAKWRRSFLFASSVFIPRLLQVSLWKRRNLKLIKQTTLFNRMRVLERTSEIF